MQEFNMRDLGEAKTIIGWEITQDLQAGILKIDQKGYIQDFLKSKGMSSCHSTVLPMKAGSTFALDQVGDHLQANLVAYQRLIGKLMYLACRTQPDIAFVVGQLSWHNSDLPAGQLRIAKQVLRYLKGTIILGIIWGNNPAGHRQKDVEDRKSITRYCFFLGGAITTWCIKRQRTVSTSTSEAEYVAMSHEAREEV